MQKPPIWRSRTRPGAGHLLGEEPSLARKGNSRAPLGPRAAGVTEGEAARWFSDSDGSFAPHALHSGTARRKIRRRLPIADRLTRGRAVDGLARIQGKRQPASDFGGPILR